MSDAFRTRVRDVADIGRLAASAPRLSWDHWSVGPDALMAADDDVRWRGEVVAATDASGSVVGYLGRWEGPSAALPRQYHTAALPEAAAGGGRVTVLGGRGDMHGSIVFDHALPPAARADVAHRLLVEALDVDTPVIAPFVDEPQWPYFDAGAVRASPCGDRYTLHLRARSEDEFIESLSRSRRSLVRRDYRDLERAAIETRRVSPHQANELATRLIPPTKARHGIDEPGPLLTRRLRRWAVSTTEPVAFVVGVAGHDIAVSFVSVQGDAMCVYDAGVDWTDPRSHLCYLAAVFYGPIRLATERAARRIDLGHDAAHPKRLRGAVGIGCATFAYRARS